MRFEVELACAAAWVLRAAGLNSDQYQAAYRKSRDVGQPSYVPFTAQVEYLLADRPVEVSIACLRQEPAHLLVESPDDSIGKSIQDVMQRYSVENDGEAVAQAEFRSYGESLRSIFLPGGLQLNARAGLVRSDGTKGVLNRGMIDALCALFECSPRPHRFNIANLLHKKYVARADRRYVGSWLLSQLPRARDPAGERDLLSPLWQGVTHPGLADDMIALLVSGYPDPGGLLAALAATKDPRAAGVIASLGDRQPWAVIDCLRQLRATEFAPMVRTYLKHPDSEIRQLARKTLGQLGFPVEKYPPPVHRVSSRRKIPVGLKEWSMTMGVEDIEPVFLNLATFVDSGFSALDIKEIVGVAEAMEVEQSRAFRFPISANGKQAELWVSLFMDDIDLPEVAVFGPPDVIEKFTVEADKYL